MDDATPAGPAPGSGTDSGTPPGSGSGTDAGPGTAPGSSTDAGTARTRVPGTPWDDLTGVVALPSGVLVRGRPLSAPACPADFTLALAEGPLPSWPYRRVDWPDFRVPADRADALDALREALGRAHAGERVEAACRGGRGRTGTALAALAILDGLPAADAVRWVRTHYDRHAVETPWQRLWLRRLPSRTHP